jgi:hypothetical protein
MKPSLIPVLATLLSSAIAAPATIVGGAVANPLVSNRTIKNKDSTVLNMALEPLYIHQEVVVGFRLIYDVFGYSVGASNVSRLIKDRCGF